MLDIDEELKAAMRSGEKDKLSVLRMLKSSLVNTRIAVGHELTDDEVVRVLKREAKARADAAAMYKTGGREELAAKELNEQKLIETYLPESLPDDKIAELIDTVQKDMGPEFAQRNFGQIMQKVLAKAAGQADGGRVSELVRARLNQKEG